MIWPLKLLIFHTTGTPEKKQKIEQGPSDTIEFRMILATKLDFPDAASSPIEQIVETLAGFIDTLTGLIDHDPDASIVHTLKCLRLLSFDFTGRFYYLVDFPNWLYTAKSFIPGYRFCLFKDDFINKIIQFYNHDLNTGIILQKFAGNMSSQKTTP